MELKRLSNELLAGGKKNCTRTIFVVSTTKWSELYKYIKRRKGNREIIPAIKEHNGTIITDTTEKANILYPYYASVFCCDRNIPKIKNSQLGETIIINTKVIRKRLTKIGRNNSVGPDRIRGEIVKLGGEAMTPFLARLL